MAITDSPGETVLRLEIVGKRPKNKPYLRIAHFNGDYIASIDSANVLRGLANQILRALDGKPKSNSTRILRKR